MLLIWNKIIRKIAQLLTHKRTADTEATLNMLRSNFRKVIINENYYLLTEDTISYKLRKSTSDYEVFKQVVVGKEYQPIIEYLSLNKIKPTLIIDCGANIGLTTIQFSIAFPNSKIISIEPDEKNFKMLRDNTRGNLNITTINKAIWSGVTSLKIDRSFRDGQEWSVRTIKESSLANNTVQTITILKLLEESKCSKIDFLKIDIEGAEAELFNNESNYEFLNYTNCIAIEIHDECVDRNKIYTILKSKSFIIFNSGELTIGIRK